MWTARILPLAGMSAALAWLLLSGRSVTVEDILSYTPAQPLLAAAFLWLGFALKSLSMVFPVYVLFAVSGQIFPLPVALAVNIFGVAVTVSVPYLLGRASELDFTERLLEKYPRLQELRRMRPGSAGRRSKTCRPLSSRPAGSRGSPRTGRRPAGLP